MEETEKAIKVTISLYPNLWYGFRVACVLRKTTASKEIQRLLQAQLTAWATEAQQETDHA